MEASNVNKWSKMVTEGNVGEVQVFNQIEERIKRKQGILSFFPLPRCRDGGKEEKKEEILKKLKTHPYHSGGEIRRHGKDKSFRRKNTTRKRKAKESTHCKPRSTSGPTISCCFQYSLPTRTGIEIKRKKCRRKEQIKIRKKPTAFAVIHEGNRAVDEVSIFLDLPISFAAVHDQLVRSPLQQIWKWEKGTEMMEHCCNPKSSSRARSYSEEVQRTVPQRNRKFRSSIVCEVDFGASNVFLINALRSD